MSKVRLSPIQTPPPFSFLALCICFQGVRYITPMHVARQGSHTRSSGEAEHSHGESGARRNWDIGKAPAGLGVGVGVCQALRRGRGGPGDALGRGWILVLPNRTPWGQPHRLVLIDVASVSKPLTRHRSPSPLLPIPAPGHTIWQPQSATLGPLSLAWHLQVTTLTTHRTVQ